jgi:TIR domain
VSGVGQPIRVFISYAHEPGLAGHRDRVLDVAQSFRLRGIEATIDQFVEHDPPVWPRWMTDQVRDADFVLCVASPSYKERVENRGDPATGRGARWEGAIITEELYSQFPNAYKKFIAVVLEGCSADDIPDVLLPLGRSYYVLPHDDEDLYRRLTGQPRVVPAPLGAIVQLTSSVKVP